jgi:hypothetical protein
MQDSNRKWEPHARHQQKMGATCKTPTENGSHMEDNNRKWEPHARHQQKVAATCKTPTENGSHMQDTNRKWEPHARHQQKMGATCKTPTERLHEYTKHTKYNRNKYLQRASGRRPISQYIT